MIDPDKYRQFVLTRYSASQSVSVYAGDERNAGEAIVYITSGGFSCGLHMTPDEARNMAKLLNMAADEATPMGDAA